MTKRKPNFLVIMMDQLRWDHLGCYGNSIVQTPNIDAIADTGLRFDAFYTSNPICQPNRACLATGQISTVNGCRQNGIPISLDSVTYAGLPSSPYADRVPRICPKGTGGLFTFALKAGYEACVKFVDAVEIFSHVANLGDTRSLVIHSASTTHRQLTEEQQKYTRMHQAKIR